MIQVLHPPQLRVVPLRRALGSRLVSPTPVITTRPLGGCVEVVVVDVVTVGGGVEIVLVVVVLAAGSAVVVARAGTVSCSGCWAWPAVAQADNNKADVAAPASQRRMPTSLRALEMLLVRHR